jgi:hypothetical protein
MTNPVNTNVVVRLQDVKPKLPPNQIRIRHPLTGEETVRKFTIYENGQEIVSNNNMGRAFARAAAQIALTQTGNNEMFKDASIEFGNNLRSLQGLTKPELLQKNVSITQGFATRLDGTSTAFGQSSLLDYVPTARNARGVAVSKLEDYRKLNSTEHTAGAIVQARPAGNPNQPNPAAQPQLQQRQPQQSQSQRQQQSQPQTRPQQPDTNQHVSPQQQTQVIQQGQNIEDANQSHLYQTVLNSRAKANAHQNPLATLVDQLRTMNGKFKDQASDTCNTTIRQGVAKELWDNSAEWINDEQFNQIFKSLQTIITNDSNRLFQQIAGFFEIDRFNPDRGVVTRLLNSRATFNISPDDRKILVRLYAKYIRTNGEKLDATFFGPFVKVYDSFQVVCVSENVQANETKISYFTQPGLILPSQCAFIYFC